MREPLAVASPGFKPVAGVRAIAPPDFLPVVIGAAWSGKLSLIAQQCLAELEAGAETLRAGS